MGTKRPLVTVAFRMTVTKQKALRSEAKRAGQSIQRILNEALDYRLGSLHGLAAKKGNRK